MTTEFHFSLGIDKPTVLIEYLSKNDSTYHKYTYVTDYNCVLEPTYPQCSLETTN